MTEELKKAFQELVSIGKEAIGTVAEGVGKAYDFAQSSQVMNDMANHGRSELAAGFFNQSAYVMYQRSNQVDQPANENKVEAPSVEVHQPEITQSKGMSM
jgi:hypothetical protein